MISILISTYNYNCYRLVSDLHRLCEASGTDYEILVGDDCSRDQLSVIANMKVKELSHCQYLPSTENCGQACTRNRLALAASGEHLLFIDCDARVDDEKFILRYLQHADDADVVVGGLTTVTLPPDEIVSRCETADLGRPHSVFVVNRSLRYRYEHDADLHRSATERNRQPYHSLTCFNLMIRREVFLQVKFCEQCRQYGYEDVLFGAELQAQGVSIIHIDNPLTHLGIDTNQQFLQKTETALHSLLQLDGITSSASRLKHHAERLHSLHLAPLAAHAFKLMKPLLRRNLLGSHPSLFVFSAYKLGYFLCLEREKA